MRPKLRLALAAIAALLPLGAMGNDTEYELSAGGLVFKQNPFIEMRSEDLFISMEKIRVVYTFFNRSNTDITTTVAFPMPDITMSEDYQPQAEGPRDFETIASGKKVSTSVDRKVYARGVDQTAVLRRLGVPLDPHSVTETIVKRLTSSDSKHLKELGLLNGGKPQWTLKTTFFWNQTFPARRIIVIEHRYKPSVGGSVVTGLGSNLRYYELKYCTDKNFVDTVARTEHTAQYSEHWISYILTTGANWAGPIRSFRLTVDKGKPSNLVSFCADGVRKSSPTEFQVTKKNYIPNTDLEILIIEPISHDNAQDNPPGVRPSGEGPFDRFTQGGPPGPRPGEFWKSEADEQNVGTIASAACIALNKNTTLSFEGMLTHRIFAGPPNYEDVRRGDAPEPSFILKLDHPICVTGDDFSDSSKNIDRIQVYPEHSFRDDRKIWNDLRSLIGRRVLVEGKSAFGAHTGHHHAPLLLPITRIEAALDPTESYGTAATTVEGFYLALGAANGTEAVKFLIPEKRVGPLSAEAITDFYGSLIEPLTIKDIVGVNIKEYRVTYSFKARNFERCNGVALVKTVKSHGANLIASIKALNGC